MKEIFQIESGGYVGTIALLFLQIELTAVRMHVKTNDLISPPGKKLNAPDPGVQVGIDSLFG